MLEPNRIQAVDPSEVSFCEACGARYRPGLQFVAFDNGAQDVPGGLIETAENTPGQVAYRARDGLGGTTTLTVRKLMLCSDCIHPAAELTGYGDTAPLHAELADKDEQLEATRQQLERSEEEGRDRAATIRSMKSYEALLPDRDERDRLASVLESLVERLDKPEADDGGRKSRSKKD